MIITGVGSRECPQDVCDLFIELGAEARQREWWIRSGHAEGADYAFEQGALKHCITYLPWETFNESLPLLGVPRTSPLRSEVLDFVYKYEPYAEKLSQGVKRIKSRNVYQVLGEDLKTPSNLLVCWTPYGEITGGTALAIKIAVDHNIPVVNVGDPKIAKSFNSIMEQIVREVELC